MTPMLKPPGIERLKLKCDKLVSRFAFNFKLRRYSEGDYEVTVPTSASYGRSEVGQCRLTVSKPVLKAPMVSVLERDRGFNSSTSQGLGFGVYNP